MGLLDVILGKKHLGKANLDKIFALSTAQVTLDVSLGLRTAGSAAVVFKQMSAEQFARGVEEMRELVRAAADDTGSEIETTKDEYGFQWLVCRDPDIEDLVTLVHAVSSQIKGAGFGEQLLAAVFRFEGGEHPVYLIYGYKRGAFWPFVPLGDGKKRDNAYELRLKNDLEQELPFEPDLSRWMALFGAPL